MIPDELDFENELPYSQADYEAVKQIALRNGGEISNEEIFGVIVRGYGKMGKIKNRLIAEGYIEQTDNE